MAQPALDWPAEHELVRARAGGAGTFQALRMMSCRQVAPLMHSRGRPAGTQRASSHAVSVSNRSSSPLGRARDDCRSDVAEKDARVHSNFRRPFAHFVRPEGNLGVNATAD
jgi:hypothetical protein